MADKNVKYQISLEDKFSKKMNKAGQSVNSFDNKIDKANKSTTSLVKKLGVAAGALFVLKKGFDLTAKSFKLGAAMEQTEIAFGTFLRSAEKGKKVIAELNEFANVTPYDNEEIIKSGRVLLAAGIPANKLTDRLKSLGDVASGANVPITDLANIYAKAMNKGKLQAEELNQLAERGIPIIEVLSKEFGVTKQEVFELGSTGKITSEVMNDAFNSMTKKGGLFFNLMKKQSASATGLISTFTGKIKLVATNLGQRMLPAVKDNTKQLIKFADRLLQITKIKTSEEITRTRIALNAELNVLKTGNMTIEQRRFLIGEINTKYKDYLPNLLTEKSTIEDIEKAQKAANKELLKRINTEAKKELIEKTISRAVRLQVKLLDSQIKREEKLIKLGAVNEDGSTRRLTNLEKLTFAAKGLFNPLTESEAAIKNLEKRAKKAAQAAASFQQKLNLPMGSESSTGTTDGTAIATPSPELSKGISTIKSAAPKTFNINIGKFVENFTVKSETLNESAGDVREKVIEMFTRALADVKAVAT